MYKNVGKKIKIFAIVFAWIIIAVSSFFAFYRFFLNEFSTESIIISAGIIVGGCIIAVVLSWFLYAFGVITEANEATKESLENLEFAIENLTKELTSKRKNNATISKDEIPLGDFKLPETREELFSSQLKKLKKDYEMSKITYDEYEKGKRKLEQKYK